MDFNAPPPTADRVNLSATQKKIFTSLYIALLNVYIVYHSKLGTFFLFPSDLNFISIHI